MPYPRPAPRYDAQTEQERAENRPSMNLERQPSGSFLGGFKARAKMIQKELDSFRAQTEDEVAKNQLKLKKLNEGELKDTEVLYGDEIQFQHVATGKFLSAGSDLNLRVVDGGNQVSITQRPASPWNP